jgi:hypothetical protein
MRDESRSRCLARCLFGAAVCIAAAVLPSTAAALTVFDFDDFPANPGGFDPDGVNTTIYGCRGKDFCTNQDINDARDNAIPSISTTRDGIEATFTRPPSLSGLDGVGVLPQGGPGGFLNPGNVEGFGDYKPYVADFSKELLFAQVSVALNSENEMGDFAFLEIWSDPGATGTLLGRAEGAPGLLSISAPKGTSFRSIRFGIGLDMPGCESGCYTDDGEQGFADDIGLRPVPEPGGALLFATGTAVAGFAIRRRDGPSCRSCGSRASGAQ